ncbi:MAG: DNA mismatch repair protein MutS [Thermoanaerobaculaceae bacterium]|nr:DNA mismatch repair protein MutS [Thermoanaerobaculaceae bacterium]
MKQTPMLQQYLALKQEHPDAILFYRLGDFYELFFEDAEKAAPILGLVLTQRRHNEEVTSPMCGVPHHAVSSYVAKLVEAGFRVALAEQVEDPAKVKGLVRRQVVRVFTPGTLTDPEMLADGERRYVASLLAEGEEVAVAYLETASGEFGGAWGRPEAIRLLLAHLAPREVLLCVDAPALDGIWPEELARPVVTTRHASWFSVARAEELLLRCLNVGSLRAFDLAGCAPLVAAAGALLEYVRSTQGSLPQHLDRFVRHRLEGELLLDAATVRNLEIVQDAAGGRHASLVRTLDRTVTSMGARCLRDWLVAPAGDPAVAEARHGAVTVLADSPQLLASVREALKGVGDLERAASRLGFRQARPAELAALRRGLAVLPALRALLRDAPAALLAELGAGIDELGDLAADLARTLAEEPPALVGPGTIRSGVDAELDEARQLAHSAKEVLGELEAKERARTGIASLRIRYNRVFGYAFEVSRANLAKVPEDFVRRQTLAGAERFVTAELVDLERRIVTAEARAEEREGELFAALLDRCAACSGRVAATARGVAAVDVLAAFATTARERGYVRPRLVRGARLRLVASRHPVIEALGKAPFVPNDLELDAGTQQILILTGPNMGGKSTFLRQAALAVVMARAGSFVAAEEAEIGEFDRIFTRVGAADDIARGESTFMVEMTEVAHILRHATARSLVILDEVGRGTATFDGLSLAWAVVEALHDPPGGGPGPLVLFATHYHELTDLAARLERVVNASLAVKEWQGQVLFLHRVVPGPADRSYGIHVARLAGVPESVCRRAQEVLGQLEQQELHVVEAVRPEGEPIQLHLFPAPPDLVVERLRQLDVTTTTPLEALNLLAELRRLVAEGG